MLNMPKYMKNLHILVSGIMGTPRIVSVNLEKVKDKQCFMSEKYKDIPQDEWDAALMAYFSHFGMNQRQLAVSKDGWAFFIGGNFDTADNLIKCLKNCIEEIKKLEAQENCIEEVN